MSQPMPALATTCANDYLVVRDGTTDTTRDLHCHSHADAAGRIRGRASGLFSAAKR
jgi:hypothetical protein